VNAMSRSQSGTRGERLRAIATLLLTCLLAGSGSIVGAQTDAQDQTADDQQTTDNSKKEKRGSLVIAPIPISSPAFGSGLILIGGYVFKLDKDDQASPPSWLGGAGVFTNNGSRGLALGGRLYFSENKYQTTFAAIKGAGLRFKLDKANHINYRIDFAVGRAGRTISIGIGEAF